MSEGVDALGRPCCTRDGVHARDRPGADRCAGGCLRVAPAQTDKGRARQRARRDAKLTLQRRAQAPPLGIEAMRLRARREQPHQAARCGLVHRIDGARRGGLPPRPGVVAPGDASDQQSREVLRRQRQQVLARGREPGLVLGASVEGLAGEQRRAVQRGGLGPCIDVGPLHAGQEPEHVDPQLGMRREPQMLGLGAAERTEAACADPSERVERLTQALPRGRLGRVAPHQRGEPGARVRSVGLDRQERQQRERLRRVHAQDRAVEGELAGSEECHGQHGHVGTAGGSRVR